MNLKQIVEKFKNNNIPKTHPSDEEIYDLSTGNRNVFLESLNELTADDLAPAPEKSGRTAGDAVSSLIRTLVLLASAVVFIFSASTLVRSFVDYKRADDLYGEIAGNIFDSDFGASGKRAVSLSPVSTQMTAMPDYYTGLSEDAWEIVDGGSNESYNIKFQQMKANLTHLKTINPDIYGYIHIEGTNISYPIVQSDDNEYYLDYAYTGDYMVVGSIFADFRVQEQLDKNRNAVFYGHNINTGIMFNHVTKFFEEDVFNEKIIEIYTFDGIYYYKPFSIHQTVSTYQYFKMGFATNQEFVDFCEEMKSNSAIKNDTTFTGDDKIITLSTCTNVGNGRYALHAKLIKVEQ
ncbi:MAG: class B sortase [Ruminococcaceae bacterium]|nr:class B sortase [Oscillospiraceae bacterium]